MPIRLITGLPGHGKTLLMVSQIMEQAAKADRPMYEAGVDGLAPGICTNLADARQWNAIDPDAVGTCTCGKRSPHAHLVPDGSIIYVDEAWKWFGHMHDARGQKAPDAVLELAEHRHRGIDFVWTTQGPSQIYPFARTLIADHTHVVRRFGTSFCSLYSWGELNEDVKSQSMRASAVTRQWGFPRAMFDKYKSATQHTIKRKIPFRLFLIPACIVMAVVLGAFALKFLSPSATAARAGAPLAATGLPVSPATDQHGDGHPKYTTALSYVVAHTPRVASQPWSAPVYDGRRVTTDPRIFCMITAQDKKNSSCHCYTEQATPYQARLDDSQCRNIALWGNYDPYKVEARESQPVSQSETVQRPQVDQRAAARTSGQSSAFAQQPHYGQIHTESAANDKGYDSHAFQ